MNDKVTCYCSRPECIFVRIIIEERKKLKYYFCENWNKKFIEIINLNEKHLCVNVSVCINSDEKSINSVVIN